MPLCATCTGIYEQNKAKVPYYCSINGPLVSFRENASLTSKEWAKKAKKRMLCEIQESTIPYSIMHVFFILYLFDLSACFPRSLYILRGFFVHTVCRILFL